MSEVAVTRAWGWGIAILGTPEGDIPEWDPEQPVSVGESVLVISVRHAQDVDVENGETEATVTIYVRTVVQPEVSSRVVLCDAVLATPGARMSLGDADEELVFSVTSVQTRVILSAEQFDPAGLERVWVDLIPVKE